jgi:hypothetical protein
MFALPKTGVAGKPHTRLVYLMAKSKTQKKETDSANGQVNSRRSQKAPVTGSNSSGNDENLSPFLRKQKGKLLHLRDIPRHAPVTSRGQRSFGLWHASG